MTEIQIHIAVLAILSLGFLYLSIWMFRTYERSPSITYYSAFLLGLAVLAGVSSFIVAFQSDRSLLLFSARLGYFAGAATGTMFLMFTLYWPVPLRNIPNNAHLLWVIPLTFLLPFIFFNPSFVREVVSDNGLPREVVGSMYGLLPIFILTYFFIALRNLIVKIPQTLSLRRQLKFVIAAVALSGGASILIDVMLPAFTIRIPHYLSQEFSIAIFGMTTYFVFRKG